MRIRITLLSITVLMLFGAACSRNAPQYRTDGTIKDIMDSVVDPNADYLWESVSTTATIKGIEEKAPTTDEDWKNVRRHAIALMEATNLLQIPGRLVARPGEKPDDPRVELAPDVIQTIIDADRADWTTKAHVLYDATALVLKAVEAKNTDGLLDAGDRIDKACEDCHLKYWYPRQLQLQKDNPSSTSVRRAP